jgi:Zn-finger nucleic acid-binding protein
MRCPDCDTLLRAAAAPAHEVCPRCRGEWHELPVLAAALHGGDETGREDDGSAHRRALRAQVPRRCPVCRAVLRPRVWASTLPPHSLETCPLAHGAWLPAGERAAVAQAALRARAFLDERRPYLALLVAAAARRFVRASRAGRRPQRRSALARLFS